MKSFLSRTSHITQARHLVCLRTSSAHSIIKGIVCLAMISSDLLGDDNISYRSIVVNPYKVPGCQLKVDISQPVMPNYHTS